MTMKSMKYQECDTIMDNYNPAIPPPLPRRVPPVRNIYAEPFETNTSRWVIKSFFAPYFHILCVLYILCLLLAANNHYSQSHCETQSLSHTHADLSMLTFPSFLCTHKDNNTMWECVCVRVHCAKCNSIPCGKIAPHNIYPH
jgi:hypothetical protein